MDIYKSLNISFGTVTKYQNLFLIILNEKNM